MPGVSMAGGICPVADSGDAGAGLAGEPQACRAADESPSDREDTSPAAQAHCHSGARQRQRSGPAGAGLRPRGPGQGVVLRHYLYPPQMAGSIWQ